MATDIHRLLGPEVDQGIGHTAGASSAPNPVYFDPDDVVKPAIA